MSWFIDHCPVPTRDTPLRRVPVQWMNNYTFHYPVPNRQNILTSLWDPDPPIMDAPAFDVKTIRLQQYRYPADYQYACYEPGVGIFVSPVFTHETSSSGSSRAFSTLGGMS